MNSESSDFIFMRRALVSANQAAECGEVPIGAILVAGDSILAESNNAREKTRDPIDHAEIRLLRHVCAERQNWRLNDCTLYVTVEPCPMCLGALFQARVGRLVLGCFDDKRLPVAEKADFLPSLKTKLDSSGTGQIFSSNHYLKISAGILQDECAALLRDFFRQRRS